VSRGLFSLIAEYPVTLALEGIHFEKNKLVVKYIGGRTLFLG